MEWHGIRTGLETAHWHCQQYIWPERRVGATVLDVFGTHAPFTPLGLQTIFAGALGGEMPPSSLYRGLDRLEKREFLVTTYIPGLAWEKTKYYATPALSEFVEIHPYKPPPAH